MARAILLLGALAPFAGLPGVAAYLPRRRHGDWRAALRRATPNELAEQVAGIVRAQGWERHGSGRALTELPSTQPIALEALAHTLDSLYAELTREDTEAARSGRDGAAFDFYEVGLAGIREVLASRLAPDAPGGRPRAR